MGTETHCTVHQPSQKTIERVSGVGQSSKGVHGSPCSQEGAALDKGEGGFDGTLPTRTCTPSSAYIDCIAVNMYGYSQAPYVLVVAYFVFECWDANARYPHACHGQSGWRMSRRATDWNLDSLVNVYRERPIVSSP